MGVSSKGNGLLHGSRRAGLLRLCEDPFHFHCAILTGAATTATQAVKESWNSQSRSLRIQVGHCLRIQAKVPLCMPMCTPGQQSPQWSVPFLSFLSLLACFRSPHQARRGRTRGQACADTSYLCSSACGHSSLLDQPGSPLYQRLVSLCLGTFYLGLELVDGWGQ